MEFQTVYNQTHDGVSALEEHKPKGSASLAAVISAFIPTWVTSLIFITIFILIRRRFPFFYAPRTFMGSIPEKHRTPPATRGYLDWFHTMRKIPDKFILYHQSLDAYLFLRFLRIIMFLCVVGCFLTWPTLMPVNALGGGKSVEFDRIGIGNVAEVRFFYAHAVLACVFFSFVMFTIARERLWLVGLRQAWTLERPNAERLSSRTVLFLSAPTDALYEGNMKTYFGDAAVRIWPVTKAEALDSLVSDRIANIEKLEAAEIALIRRASRRAKWYLKESSRRNGAQPDRDELIESARNSSRPKRYLKIPGDGKTVDAIKWYREQIKKIQAKIEELRASYESGDPRGGAAVFVEYTTLAEAQRSCQQIASADVLSLSPRYTGVSPSEVIWDNLTLHPARRISQEGVASAIIIATIVFWSIPSGFVGLVSNISALAETVEWLSFLKRLPKAVLSLLSGLLPPLATSWLSSFVPKLFRYIIKTFGGPTTTANELRVQRWYYIFQVVQVFLVTAVFSGAAAVASELIERARNPTSIPELLARQLPRASNFYLTYFIIQGTTSAADNLLNHSDLLEDLIFGYLFDRTPRQKFARYTSLKGMSWGKVFPKFANFAIIAIAYSCIAPLVLGFAAAGVALYYFAYRYNLLFTLQPKLDTRGLAYILALQHLLTGLYIGELALIGFFGLRKATGPVVIVSVLLVGTIAFNTLMNKYLAPLEHFIPTEIASSAASEISSESTPLLRAEEGDEESQAAESHIQRLAQRAHAPEPVTRHVIKPVAKFFEPNVFASYEAMRRWLREGCDYHNGTAAAVPYDEDDVPRYTEDQLRKAYLNPVLTSPTPPVWLARDGFSVSAVEVAEIEACGLNASDRGAWLDEKGKLRWNKDDFSEVPIWKEKVVY